MTELEKRETEVFNFVIKDFFFPFQVTFYRCDTMLSGTTISNVLEKNSQASFAWFLAGRLEWEIVVICGDAYQMEGILDITEVLLRSWNSLPHQ